MYNIVETTAQNSAGNWVKPTFDWAGLKQRKFNGLYILAHKNIKDGDWRTDDNKNLGVIRDEAIDNDFRTGLWINPDGVNVSYAKAFLDLASKVGINTAKQPGDATDSLLPCVLVSSWPAGYKVNQIEGDFFAYFNSILLGKFNNIVLCLNKATADFLVNSGSKLILDTLALPSVRIWYYRPGLTAAAMDAELMATPAKKHVWIAGLAIGESQADWSTAIDPTPPPAPAKTKDQRLAVLFREVAKVLEEDTP
ncbi:MAG: hypothetical protein IMZ62_07450 [Chloroflexi bacterium]|nr:hypothetical protein [Chloroflexota bacterium]